MTTPIRMETGNYVGCISNKSTNITFKIKPMKPDIAEFNSLKSVKPKSIFSRLFSTFFKIKH